MNNLLKKIANSYIKLERIVDRFVGKAIHKEFKEEVRTFEKGNGFPPDKEDLLEIRKQVVMRKGLFIATPILLIIIILLGNLS